MSLGITVDVNGGVIIKMYAQRVTNTGGKPADDDVSEYAVTKVTQRIVWTKQYDYDIDYTYTNMGRIMHRYGDGAHILAMKVLALYDST